MAEDTNKKTLRDELINRATGEEVTSNNEHITSNDPEISAENEVANEQEIREAAAESNDTGMESLSKYGTEIIIEEGEDNGGDMGGADEGIGYVPKYVPGEVIERSIVEEMKASYLDYSMSVIVARALPEVRDGLKPSQRRILVAMNDLNLTPQAHYRKSAKIAGDTSGNYHPHGESVIYPTMVKLAQDFSTRYPLVDGQGNFGSVDGDTAAAMRYTEAKMSKYTMELLRDIEKGTVTFSPNYDATRDEPNVLPALFPNLICNGSEGIAVGMATKIAPHNLSEVIDALREMIKRGNKWEGQAIYNSLRLERESGERIPLTLDSHPHSLLTNYVDENDIEYTLKTQQIKERINNPLVGEDGKETLVSLYPGFESDISIDEIVKIIPGPDFPTGGIIYDRSEVTNTFATGRGRVLIRAKAAIEENANGRFQILVTELPYQVNKAKMIEAIADLVKDKKIEGISDIRDESNREGMRVVIILKKEAQPKVVLNKLYKFTDMQLAFNSNMIALVDGEPETLTMKRILELFLSHRIQITIRRYEFDLAQARYRNHIVDGLLKALDILDEVIRTIRASKTQDEARTSLIMDFDFTTVQADAILDMQLRKLAALEREKLQNEGAELKTKIANYIDLLASQDKILNVVDEDLAFVKEKYGDARRTKVVSGKVDEISDEDIVASETTLITLSRGGYIKRLSPDTYRTQKRGGKGVIGATTKEDDYIQQAVTCNTHDELLLFTNKGRVFTIKAYDIPEFQRTAKGIPIVNLIQVLQGEIVTSILNKNFKKSLSMIKTEEELKELTPEEIKVITEYNAKIEALDLKYLFMATKFGTVKKSAISDFQNIRANGLIAIKLQEGDELNWIIPTTGENNVILVTANGKCIRFKESDVRHTGRATMGVTGIRFKSTEDVVISMDVVYAGVNDVTIDGKKPSRLFSLSENGYAKTTKLTEYDSQNRGGTGVFTFKVTGKTGKLVVSKIVLSENDEIIVISTQGQVIRTSMDHIPTLNRQTQGVRVMNMHEGDTVAAMAVL
jgi:DNA gyrase subunit A